MIKKVLKSALLTASILSALAVAGIAQKGAFRPIENGDAGAGLAADSAVMQQAKKTKTTITPATILKAEDKEPTIGTRNFRLCLSTTVNGKPMTPQVVVTMDQYSNFKLVSWTASTCGKALRSSTVEMPIAGGYSPLDKDNAGAGLAADFAVKEKSAETKTAIGLVDIVKAESQVVAGTNFRLCMNVSEEGKSSFVQAVVYMDLYSNLKLTSWEPSTCGGGSGSKKKSADGFETVSNSDAGIGLAADFAVKKHSEEKKITHTLLKILKAEEKGMFSMTYRVCMQVAEKDEKVIVQAVVTMDQYSNLKLVSWGHSECGN